MTPESFIDKWRGVDLSESAASHDHFNELCALLEVEKPTDVDKRGEWFAFEKPVPKAGKAGAAGFADVWRKGCFVWEYKRRNRLTTLAAAIAQAREYAALLDNPPLAIACDIDEIQVRTLFTGSVSVTHAIRLADLNDVGKRQLLRRCFTDPQALRPDLTPRDVTEEAARKFATLAQTLRERRDRIGRPHDARRVAHFLNRIVFCLFAEDAGLLPGNVFGAIVEQALRDKSGLSQMLADLFDKMRTGTGFFGAVRIPHFNGGLFDDDDVLDLLFPEVQVLGEAMRLDWAHIEPVIFGTLFERGLDPARRKQMAGLFDAAPGAATGRKGKRARTTAAPAGISLPLRGGATAAERSLGKGVGIHYTDPATIMKIVEPVVLRPLRAEWDALKAALDKARGQKRKDDLYLRFRERLGAFRVLDPACGSGNFLYLALRHLKDFDRDVEREAKALGLSADPKGQRVTPHSVLGIEINPYAAELARVTVWIGELQWQMANGYGITRRPILGALNGIENRDALLNEDGTEAEWPKASVVIGNPPFLGGKLLRRTLGDKTVDALFEVYRDRVRPEADLVCYWLAKAADLVVANELAHAGFVTTNSIRGGANRGTLDRLAEAGLIFEAWSDEGWVLDGAAVRVSLVCFGRRAAGEGSRLDGRPTQTINADLTNARFDITKARRLAENAGIAFMGDTKGGGFDIPGSLARQWLQLPKNPNGRSNANVLRPWINGFDVTRRPQDKWIIDFGWTMTESEAALYEAPFEYVVRTVKPERLKNKRKLYAEYWWRHVEPRPGMWAALRGLKQFIVTPTVCKHRVFRRVPASVCPDHQLIVMAMEDDSILGVLQSRAHELWAVSLGTSLEDRPRYTPTTTFETFPFPNGSIPIALSRSATRGRLENRIASAAAELDELRERWLSPPDLGEHCQETVAGYPARLIPRSVGAVEQLKKRTLTNLYNERPRWLSDAHRDLDRAVAAAYGWPEMLADRAQPDNLDKADRAAAEEEILGRLFDLNQQRAKAGR